MPPRPRSRHEAADDENETPDAETSNKNDDVDNGSGDSGSRASTADAPALQNQTPGEVSERRGDDDLPANTKEVRVKRRDGSYAGQLVPDEESDQQKLLAKNREKAHRAYYDGKEECPHCHVADGVRKGNNHCDSCGATWKPKSKTK